ncbi:LysR substrate-binding domain-containing protein [Paraburkholderia sp. BCC1885]|uniref:LysR substrate-binding domain-containing protein n=1 Tax=Paraburkholderia sp. BCC1885 TaxID=2562669 RepID=UPI001181F95C|nr:LysR substrate-binding domain-containing protein [Paraburkholderia sp. BCC1885]
MLASDESIRVIHMVAKYQSISAAAERLNKVPSAISYTVKKLEEAFGVQLFLRKGCYIELTSAGEYFISYSKAILDDFDTLKRNVQMVHEGGERELKVAVNNIVPQAVMADFICDFEHTFPSTQISLQQEVYNGCWDALYGNRVNLVIGAPHAVPSTEGIVSEPLGLLTWDFVVGSGHPLAGETHTLLNSQLRRYPAVCIRDTAVNFNPMQAWLLDGQKPIFVPDFPTAIALIRRNVGIGYIPTHLRRDPAITGLVKKSTQEQKHATRLFLAHRPEALGRSGKWCVDYFSRQRVRQHVCGGNVAWPGTAPAIA